MKIKITMAAIVALGLGAAACEDAETKALQERVAAQRAEYDAADAIKAAQAEAAKAWAYEVDRDEMRGAETKFAELLSVTEVPVRWPYNPGPARMVVRRSPAHGLDVMIAIEGQFTCHMGGRETLTVKFDDGPLQTFGCQLPAGGGPGVIFVERPQRFLTALKSAKKVIIEMPVYEAGQVQITWEIPTAPEIS